MDAASAAATGADAPKEDGEDEGTKSVDGAEELSEVAREEEKGLLLPPSSSSEEEEEEDPDLELGENEDEEEEEVVDNDVVRCVDDKEE
jgi:hypothetical protein